MLKNNKKATRQEQDPTGQATNRKKANRDNNRRLNNSARRVLNIWKRVDPKKTVRKQIVNESTDFYIYDLTDDELSLMSENIDIIINDELETELEEVPNDWYFSQYIETATRGGVIQENNMIEAILTGVAIVFLLDSAILRSDKYLEELSKAISRNYIHIKGLSSTTSRQVSQEISRGIDAGLGKRAIQRKIIERFEVSKSSSKRIVNTEINKAYNDARMGLVELYRSQGAPLAVMHISALIPTTRDHHAARHGLVYTPEAQRQWWDVDANRINCLCVAQAVKLNSSNQIENKSLQDRIIERGKEWFKNQ